MAALDFGGITAGPDGALWFTETTAGTVGSITTAGSINQYSLPSSFIPRTITSGPDGALWVVGGLLSTEIFRIATTGEITSYSDSVAGDGNYSGITTGPDGALWVTGSRGDADAVFSIALTQTNAFFNGQQSLSSVWSYLQFQNGNLFGYYSFLQGSASTATAYLYHPDLGYEYVTPGSPTGSVYFYDFASGHWWYTSSSLFPYLYDFTLNIWIYYFPDTQSPGHYSSNPRYFSNLTTGQIFTM